MPQVYFEYLFDPLCGWCYASAPALQAVAQTWPDRLLLSPCGLFAEEGARPLTPALAEYVWANDQRIAAITGQIFSENYRRHVLLDKSKRFDATAMTRALTAVNAVNPTLEFTVLQQLQKARYIAGEDTASASVTAGIVAQCMRQAGQSWDADKLALQLQQDENLARATRSRIQTAQARMKALQIRGVPQLLIHINAAVHVYESSKLYRGGDDLRTALAAWLDDAATAGLT